MSLALVSGYDSDDDNATNRAPQGQFSSDEEEEKQVPASSRPAKIRAETAAKPLPKASLLPTPDEIFQEVKGPPAFLRPEALKPIHGQPRTQPPKAGHAEPAPPPASFSSTGTPQDRKAPPPGAVISAKAQLVEENGASSSAGGAQPGGKKVVGVALPPAEAAADLLRMCEKCGIPKTFSSALGGVVCPQCKGQPDRPVADGTKKRPHVVKDKEKDKRMKGQSSHASWKSEGEMLLRQQFD